jgi:hypothetical protein
MGSLNAHRKDFDTSAVRTHAAKGLLLFAAESKGLERAKAVEAQCNQEIGGNAMNPFRGILMIVAAGIAFWRGWQIHHGQYAWMAYGLSIVALGLACWHIAHGGRTHTE